jgi:hypothetical protein
MKYLKVKSGILLWMEVVTILSCLLLQNLEEKQLLQNSSKSKERK